MRNLILTGKQGSGKTTAQRILLSEHAFWVPKTITTRMIGADENELIQVNWDNFQSGVKEGKYVLPARFGSSWYAWLAQDLAHIQEKSDPPAALNVRPYTALVLTTLIPSAIAVWLWVDPSEQLRRRTMRNSPRDIDNEMRSLRDAQDLEDCAFEPLFRWKVCSDNNIIKSLLEICQGNVK